MVFGNSELFINQNRLNNMRRQFIDKDGKVNLKLLSSFSREVEKLKESGYQVLDNGVDNLVIVKAC